ncbi:MAG: hypothetical protein ACI9TY_000443 [Alphaproteobacteria bacterium]|jgi:hypothetical protein
MKKQFTTNVVAVALAVSLTACGATIEKTDVNPTPSDTYQGEGLFSGKSGNLLDSFSNDSKGTTAAAAALPVNVYLWRASLNAVSFMPLTSASAQDGVIITDWYANPNKTNERVKVNVFVLGQTFAAQNLKVSVFKQVQKNGSWVDVPADKSTATQLEEAILTSARAMKIKVRAINS